MEPGSREGVSCRVLQLLQMPTRAPLCSLVVTEWEGPTPRRGSQLQLSWPPTAPPRVWTIRKVMSSSSPGHYRLHVEPAV